MPEFKAAINAGDTTVSEIGDLKHEIGYHGDLLNAATRLQSACKDLDRRILFSEGMRQVLPQHPRYQAELVDKIRLRGKIDPQNVYTAILSTP